MPTECSPDFFGFEPVEGRAVVAAFDAGAVTSDAGALLLGATDRTIRMMDRLASCFHDVRCPELIEHQVVTLVGQRVFGIALGYEDLNDHDELRHDPMLAVLSGKLAARREDCAPVAGKSTRLQEQVDEQPLDGHRIVTDLVIARRLQAAQLQPVERTSECRTRSSLISMRPTIRCTASRRGGSSTAITTATATCRSTCSAGAICWTPSCGARTLTLRPARWRRWRASSPRFAVVGRWCAFCCAPTSGFAREELMAWCEANGVHFLFGLAKTDRLIAEIKAELEGAAAQSRRTGKPARRFKDFRWMTRSSWSRQRRVVAKAEWTKDEANPRFVVTSLTRAECKARYLYEKVYCYPPGSRPTSPSCRSS